ncbi:MAG: transporter [Armatimonadetes bacterium]|nr:transporter [Armatimonadota bacterium]
MQFVIQLFSANPLLTLFFVAGVGFVLGKIKLLSVQLGVAAVLFTGLAVGALDPSIKLPDVLQNLGLVLFVYTLGLSSGPGFFRSFKRRGIQTTVLTLGSLLLTAFIWVAMARTLNLSPGTAAGGFTGSLTNTAALAAVMEISGGSSEPAVGYAITYPAGVVGLILVLIGLAAWSRKKGNLAPPPKEDLINRTLVVKQPGAIGKTISEVVDEHNLTIIFGRILRGGNLHLANSHEKLELGDLITTVGTPEETFRTAEILGEVSKERLEFDRREFDYRRIFVSNPDVFGKSLAELDLPTRFNATVTRLSRGDIEILPDGHTVLEPGDRVRVLTRRENLSLISKELGDSYKALSEVDVMSFALGIAIGLLIGLIEVPLPGGISFKLGVAGGPLVASLVLGALHRTGPIHWGLSFNANLTLRQIGLILFLAGVGIRSGYAFRDSMAAGTGLPVFLVGCAATVISAAIYLLIANKLFGLSGATLMGMASAIHTQPAALSFSAEQTNSDAPNVGYATVFPIASVSKIILAQLIYQFLK